MIIKQFCRFQCYGAWLLLMVDTIGRIVVLPSEISAATIMAIIGGPFLIILVQRGDSMELNTLIMATQDQKN